MVAWSYKTFHAALTCDSSVNGAPTANRRMNLPDRTCLLVAMISISDCFSHNRYDWIQMFKNAENTDSVWYEDCPACIDSIEQVVV